MSFSVASSRGTTIRRMLRIFLIYVLCCETTGEYLFKPGKQYLYKYHAETNTGVLLPSKAASSFGFNGELKIQASENSTIFQLQSVTIFAWNGEYRERIHDTKPTDQSEEMSKPFRVNHKNGLVTNFSVGNEPVWATNIKRSIAGILQLDLVNLEKQLAFYSVETNHYGQCTIEYVVTHESDDEKLIRKFSDPRTCLGHPHWTWSNVPRTHCPNDGENPVIKSSERLYKVKSDGNDSTLIYLNATGGIYVQPFQSLGESQFTFTRQSIELISVEEITQKIADPQFRDVALQHELPNDDITQGRSPIEKQVIFSSISKLLDRLSQRLENPGLDTDVNKLHNTTISILLYYLEMLDQNDLKIAYNKIAGTSYKEETIRNMFLETLPQVGTKHSALFILDLILKKEVSDITAMQLLTYLPFNIRKPNVELLTNMNVLLDLPKDRISLEVRNTGILTFGTLIYKTCLSYCPYETLDDYVRLYLDRFTETSNYDKKMVWLEGLSNIQLGRVVEFLEPIASGNSVESRHLRVLAAWASLPTAPLRPDVIYPVYWPIFVNRTEHLELRIAALTLLMASSPSANRMISLYWYMHDEPDRHLYHFFYTTLKSLERNNFPCYKHLGGIAAQFTRVLRKPSPNENIITGNYLFDYQDTKRHFGAMVQNLIIANPRTNIPEVIYMTLINHGSGANLNHISLYVKAEGLVNSLSAYMESPTRVKDILKDFNIKEKPRGEVYLEIIARVQQKAVFCLHFNQSSIEKGIGFLSALSANTFTIYQTMEFHVNQKRINIPFMMESLQATDLGTNVRLAVTANSLFSMRGNFTHQANGRNNHVIIRSVVHGRETIETYNPFIDVWHEAERTQSIHGYLPINVTIGIDNALFLLYNTPAEYMRTGVTANVRTATSIRGREAQNKLRNICPECTTLYTVRKSDEPTKVIKLFEVDVPELGGRLNVEVLDCEGFVDQENYLSDILSAHRSNYHTWPAARLPLLIAHFLDFFTYVPPKGSCGFSIYVEPGSLNPSEVKLEYVNSGGHHTLGLIRREIRTLKVLQQWTLAAVYEITDSLAETVKIKAIKTVPREKVLKVCIEAQEVTPWAWDFLSIEPSEPASVKLNIVWGLSDTAKGKCSGSSILVNLVGEVTQEQIKESKREVWPYKECREQLKGKKFVPYTEACYESSRELSTLRKYQTFVETTNLPEGLRNVIWRLQAFYNLLGGNSSHVANSNQFVIGATFPKDSKMAEIKVNKDKMSIGYDPNIIDLFLERTRLHRFLDNSLLRSIFSVCTLTTTIGTSADNVTFPVTENRELLLLAQCYEDNPRFTLRAIGTQDGITVMSDDDLGSIKIVPDSDGGTVYNFTDRLNFKRDFEWNVINAKRIRLDRKSIHLFFTDYFIFIHVTNEQVLIFFPSYMKEYSCGVCTATDLDAAKLYEKN
ncbi:uncharacterized protein [Venturia canescens]|uniref:uncharacterized protein n=1 Tax=Venturia canescens TaxID=32260 RepID=UPI001C9BDD8C|nr:uncharacterized protein LOC122414076 [Venturia canescens]